MAFGGPPDFFSDYATRPFTFCVLDGGNPSSRLFQASDYATRILTEFNFPRLLVLPQEEGQSPGPDCRTLAINPGRHVQSLPRFWG